MLQKYQNQIEQIKSGTYYGIDLGTTYTVIAVVDMSEARNTPERIPVRRIVIEQFSPLEMAGSERSDMVASVLGVRDDGRMFVGNRLYQLKGHPQYIKDVNLFYHWKLDLGVNQKPLYPDAVLTEVNDASKVAGKILNYCRKQVVDQDREWSKVLVTVPASFQNNQRNDVMKAIEYARIKPENGMLFDEPNAAFIGFLNQLSNDEKSYLFEKVKTRLLVVDFGGGTCDLSVLELRTPEKLELKMSNLAISRYNDLGGQDIDMMIAEEYLLPAFLDEFPDDDFVPEEIEYIILPQLAVFAERLKIELSRIISARFMNHSEIPETAGLISKLNNQEINVRDKQYLLEELVLNFRELRTVTEYLFCVDEHKLEVVDKVIRSVPSVITDIMQKANLAYNDIDFVLFAGGSVQNLIFVQKTMQLFKNAVTLLPQRPDTLVAEGAAVYSFYKYALGLELLQPICSDRIGVTIRNNPFFQLIEAGTPLPVTVKLPTFGIQSERQEQLVVPFCIGDANRIVGKLVVKLPQQLTTRDIISIHATLTDSKMLIMEIESGGEMLCNAELTNPFQLANVSEEERELHETLQELESAKLSNDRNREKILMKNLVTEYYALGNYNRVTALGADWLEKFDPADVNMHNLLFCAHDNLGNRRKATMHLESGLKYSPENAILIYNKGYLIEKDEGADAALQFFNKQCDRVKANDSIRFKMALLEYNHKNNRKPAGDIAEKYKLGAFDYLHSGLALNLLHRIVKLFGFPVQQNQEAGKKPADKRKSRFNDNDLLRINTSLNE